MSHHHTVRNDILIHWTGRCIQRDHTALNQQQRKAYIDRLRSSRHGLWMNLDLIKLLHEPNNQNKPFRWPITCFTEIDLESTDRHTQHYGCLGIGFSREFVMKRYGAPVSYVRGMKERDCKGAKDCISPHLLKLLGVLDFLWGETSKPSNISKYEQLIQAIDLEQFMRNEFPDTELTTIGSSSNTGFNRNIFEILLSSIITCAIFAKVMSDKECDNTYQRLDEAEWRIPWKTRIDPDIDPPIKPVNSLQSGKDPIAKITFYASDVKALILPDEGTLKMFRDDQELIDWFGKDRLHLVGTVAKCLDGTYKLPK